MDCTAFNCAFDDLWAMAHASLYDLTHFARIVDADDPDDVMELETRLMDHLALLHQFGALSAAPAAVSGVGVRHARRPLEAAAV